MTIHYDHSIVKIDGDGNRIISSYINPGERLENGQTYEELAPETDSIAPANDVHVVGDDEGDQGQGMTLDEGSNGTAPIAGNDPAESPVGDGVEPGSSNDGGPSGENGTEGDDEDKAPAKSALKDEWFAYAQSKGFEGDENDITKEQLIEQYGPKED